MTDTAVRHIGKSKRRSDWQTQSWCNNGDRVLTIFYVVLCQRRTPSTAGVVP
jgi:hypothetical protein